MRTKNNKSNSYWSICQIFLQSTDFMLDLFLSTTSWLINKLSKIYPFTWNTTSRVWPSTILRQHYEPEQFQLKQSNVCTLQTRQRIWILLVLRRINHLLIQDYYNNKLPIATVAGTTAHFAGKLIFRKLDCFQAYVCVLIADSSQVQQLGFSFTYIL